MIEDLRRRALRAREQAVIRAWQYRQRDGAQGVWYRLRRVLVDAAEVWAVEEADADRFQEMGHAPLPVGSELEPPKRIYVVPSDALETATARRRIPVGLGREFLDASFIALVAHGKGDQGAAGGCDRPGAPGGG